MSKLTILGLVLGIACAGCSSEEPPAPDPAAVEQLLVRLESQQGGNLDRLPRKTRQKVQRAERLVAPLEKVQADKINPNLALAFVE